ncbi:MAG TPA: ribokinase [Chitinophagaceae bacterium]|nr:ribokinase [Chitinophagaceae bacterium]
MKPSVVIVGSAGIDMVIKTDHLPAPGETVLGGTFFMNPGGKGANQAVAAARLNGNVIFICKTGNDIFFGQKAAAIFGKEGINTDHLLSHPDLPSAVALITVDKNAENCIVVAPGANATMLPADLVNAIPVIEEATVVLMQLEIPLTTVEYVAGLASAKNIKVVLNPAPAIALPDNLLKNISILTPNETEAEILTGIKVSDMISAEKAARVLHNKAVETVIITLGSMGALVLHEDIVTHIPAMKVVATDTTAAGDVFCAALVVGITEGRNIVEATEFACKAASLSVTKLGAQASAPYRKEVDALS